MNTFQFSKSIVYEGTVKDSLWEVKADNGVIVARAKLSGLTHFQALDILERTCTATAVELLKQENVRSYSCNSTSIAPGETGSFLITTHCLFNKF